VEFYYILKNKKINKPNMNSTIKRTVKVAEELKQSHENSNTKTEGNLNIKEGLKASLRNRKAK
jgi:hypothetical protein